MDDTNKLALLLAFIPNAELVLPLFKTCLLQLPHHQDKSVLHPYLQQVYEILQQKKMKQEVYTPVLSALAKQLCLELDKTENEQHVAVLLPLFELLASLHASIFKQFFKDVVDVLVGWYLDTGTGDVLRKAITHACLAFQTLWVTNSDFTYSLLDQFMADMQHVTSGMEMSLFFM